jgi:hypothetical protein
VERHGRFDQIVSAPRVHCGAGLRDTRGLVGNKCCLRGFRCGCMGTSTGCCCRILETSCCGRQQSSWSASSMPASMALQMPSSVLPVCSDVPDHECRCCCPSCRTLPSVSVVRPGSLARCAVHRAFRHVLCNLHGLCLALQDQRPGAKGQGWGKVGAAVHGVAVWWMGCDVCAVLQCSRSMVHAPLQRHGEGCVAGGGDQGCISGVCQFHH